MRIRVIVLVVSVAALLGGAGLYVALDRLNNGLSKRLRPEVCTVRAPDDVVLKPPQMANAATIAAVAIRRGLPVRAVTVALATALQESKLENLTGGDRDSVGLFQQRPSQGWGSAEQIADPRFAAGGFYNALVKVDGWQTMDVAAAAQAVQRSAHPDAYTKWIDEATVLARALHGDADAAVACTFHGQPAQRGSAAMDALAQDLRQDWGDAIGASADGATALNLIVANEQSGWQYAHWLVAHSRERGVKEVRFHDRMWTAADGTWTKTSTTPSAPTFEQVTARVWN